MSHSIIPAAGTVNYGTTTEIADTADTESAGSSSLVARADHVHKLHVHKPTFHTSVGAKVYRTAAQSLVNNTVTAINWTAEDFDTDTLHDNATSNTRLTVPAGMGGKWVAVAQLKYAANGTGVRQIRFHVNGSYKAYTQVSPLASDPTVFSAVAPLTLAAADYVECCGYQNSGGSLDVADATGLSEAWFAIHYLGA